MGGLTAIALGTALVAVTCVVAVGAALVAAWTGSLAEAECCAVNLEPKDVGVGVARDGNITVDVGPCARGGYHSVRLRDAGGAVLWRVDAPRPVAVTSLAVGQPARGFTEVVPLATTFDPAATYTVELSVLGSIGTSSVASTTVGADAYAVAGGTATFRPADLATERVWFGSHLVTPAVFARLACQPRDG